MEKVSDAQLFDLFLKHWTAVEHFCSSVMKHTMAKMCAVLAVILALSLPLLGCTDKLIEFELFNRFYNTNSSQAEAMLEEFLAAVESGQAQAVEKLFAKNVQENAPNLEDKIAALLRFYEGKMISYERYGPGSSASKDGRTYHKEIFCSFDVTTTVDTYRIAFLFCTIDNEYPDNGGLTSVYIIRAEDSNMDMAYWGIDNENDIWKPGINIESPVIEI